MVIYAPNVHQGGGRTLLIALLDALSGRGCVALLDRRLTLDKPLPENIKVYRFEPSFFGRLAAEHTLKRLTTVNDHVLCFGNLPPIFPLEANISVLVQNRYLVDALSLSGFSSRARRRITIERFWLRHCLRSAEIIVQTPSMARSVLTSLNRQSRILPFTPSTNRTPEPSPQTLYDFIYVASGEPHKNHKRLIQAWIELSHQGQFPSLCLTLDPDLNPTLLRWIEEKREMHSLAIFNAGHLSSSSIQKLYAESSALIYPSLTESFGLPLLEAEAAGLSIIASERDYVRDVVVPAETFDPLSPVSIARAVSRHQKIPQSRTLPLSPQAFIELLQANN